MRTAASAVIGMPAIIPASALGKNGAVAPSNRIVMGGIGIGPRGRTVLKCFLQQPEVQFVAVADVQQERREIVRRMVRRYANQDCAAVRSLFEVLERDDIDAVQVTTGDRWHTLGTILACKAGKDVYCEKPCSMTVKESQELARAVNRHARVFQAGTQRRNVDNFQFAAGLARTGKLGRIHTVHAGVTELRPDRPRLPGQPEPSLEICDWDGWLGPSPWRPYNQEYVRGRWRGHYDFHGGAGLPEWGSHTVDLCQWAAGTEDTVPVAYTCQHHSITARYENGVKLIMRPAGSRHAGSWEVEGSCPVRFEGTEGWVEAADDGTVAASRRTLLQGQPRDSIYGTNPIRHVREFLDCVKTRNEPAANARVTRQAHIACHVAAIGWQLGRAVQFDPRTETFRNDEDADRMCSRPRRKPWANHY